MVRRVLQFAILLAAIAGAAASCLAGMIVVANRTGASVKFQMTTADALTTPFAVAPGDLVSIPVNGAVGVAFQDGQERREYRLEPDSVYYFGNTQAGKLDLAEIATRAAPDKDKPADDVVGAMINIAPTKPDDLKKPVVTIPIKLLVDEEEASTPAVWKNRLNRRLQEASAILEKFTRVRLEAVAYDTWKSDNSVNEFTDSLKEFERKVDPRPARVAIGFTSQYQIPKGRTNLGGTRQPLHTHILIREWSQHVSEPERLEVLLHELGHLFGAVHSPEPDSVMRPVLGDRKALLRNFRITLDPLNTMIVSLMGQEMRDHDVRSFADLSLPTKRRLCDLYAELKKALPEDPAAGNFLRLLSSTMPAQN
jgi:hypothetical protein